VTPAERDAVHDGPAQQRGRPKPPSGGGGVKGANTYHINAGQPETPRGLQRGLIGAGVGLVVIALIGAAFGARRRTEDRL